VSSPRSPRPPPDPLWEELSSPAYLEAAGEYLLASIPEPPARALDEFNHLSRCAVAAALGAPSLRADPGPLRLPPRDHLRRLDGRRPARHRRRCLPGLRPPRADPAAPRRHRLALRLRLPVRRIERRRRRLGRGRHARLARDPPAEQRRPRRAGLGRARPDEPRRRRRALRQDRPRPPLRRRAADQGGLPRRPRRAQRARRDDAARPGHHGPRLSARQAHLYGWVHAPTSGSAHAPIRASAHAPRHPRDPAPRRLRAVTRHVRLRPLALGAVAGALRRRAGARDHDPRARPAVPRLPAGEPRRLGDPAGHAAARQPDARVGGRDADQPDQLPRRARERLSAVTVTGSVSGAHAGTLEPYSQGDGASFVPAAAVQRRRDRHRRGHLHVGHGDRAVQLRLHRRDAGPARRAARDGAHDRAGGHDPPLPLGARRDAAADPGLRGFAAGAAGGDIFLSVYPGPGQTGPEIMAPDGQVVWFLPLPPARSRRTCSCSTTRASRS
jgi:hypothetical protein